jgi:hypothetical protein
MRELLRDAPEHRAKILEAADMGERMHRRLAYYAKLFGDKDAFLVRDKKNQPRWLTKTQYRKRVGRL